MEAGKVREHTPAGARRGRAAAASCSPRHCQSEPSSASCTVLRNLACVSAGSLGAARARETRGRADPAAKAGVQACTMQKPPAPLQLPALDTARGWGGQDGAAPPFHGAKAERAHLSPSSHPPAFMGGSQFAVTLRSHPLLDAGSYRGCRYAFGVPRTICQ